MQCLANKLFIIGYFGWGYKMQSRAYAAFAMDWKLDEMGEANGGTGKSFLFEQALPKLIDTLKLDGKQKKLADSDFKFSGVTRRTRMVLIDDLYRLPLRHVLLQHHRLADREPEEPQPLQHSFLRGP